MITDKVESFKGRSWGDDEVAESDITGRALHVAIPRGSMTEERRAVFEEVQERASKLPHPVDIIVTEF